MTSTSTQIRILKISGVDAENYLQGQLTSDVSLLRDTWQFTGYCSPKGRLLSSGFLWNSSEDFYLAMHADIFDRTIARLQMYILRSKVALNEVAANVQIRMREDSPHARSSALEFGRLQIAAGVHSLHCVKHVIEIIIDESKEHSTTNSEPNVGITWSDLCVSEGLPLISSALIEEFVPQMVNLDLLRGVSFKKGCYTGQEIVARMHYLGKLKQRMFRYTIEHASDLLTNSTNNQLKAGLKLAAHSTADGNESENNASESTVAQIVAVDSSARTALIVTRVSHVDKVLRLASDANIQFTPTSLPYSITF
jgi:hypothetical protein